MIRLRCLRFPAPDGPPADAVRLARNRDWDVELAAALLHCKWVNRTLLLQLLRRSKKEGLALHDLLLATGMCQYVRSVELPSRRMNIEVVDLTAAGVEVDVAKLLDAGVCLEHELIPFQRMGGSLSVAMADPLDKLAVETVERRTGLRVRPVLASPSAIRKAIEGVHGASAPPATAPRPSQTPAPTVSGPPEEPGARKARPDFPGTSRDCETSPSALASLIVEQALERDATEIHLEHTNDGARVRLRRGGDLCELMRLTASVCSLVMNEFRQLSDLGEGPSRIPQEGEGAITASGHQARFVVGVEPCVLGQKLTLRFTGERPLAPPIEALGFDPGALARLDSALSTRGGLLLVVGPSRSGKSTTLYSALKRLSGPRVNVMTIEENVTENLDGVVQMRTNPSVFLSRMVFLSWLNAHRPDVVMVDELVDQETARAVMRQSLTGRLFLSTLPVSGGAVSALERLRDGFLERDLAAFSVKLVLAQRLVRRLCTDCREPVRSDAAKLLSIGLTTARIERLSIAGVDPSAPIVFEARGCPRCDGTGFAGQAVVCEALEPDDELRGAMLVGKPAAELGRLAVSRGMLTLRDAAMRLALEGATSLQEALQQIPPLCQYE